jgi:NAD(P)-dependent dehydrogenase (short-subunit alcohol dehydrogenase family)
MAWTVDNIPDQSGNVAVVTGGNGGLGLETVRALCQKGALVIIGARNLDKAAASEAEVREQHPAATIEVRKLDLGSVASIRAFAEEVTTSHPVVDLLFNNAGVVATPEWTTEQGFEMQFGVNHLGHFELTRLLLPALHRADAGRVVLTTSTARFSAGEYDLDNPHHRGNYEQWEAYGYSKLANLHFALELNRRLARAGSKVTAYAADPGLSYTGLQQTTAKNLPGGQQDFWATWVKRVGQSAAAGALEQLRAGTDPQATGGTLYRPRWFVRGAPVVGGIGARLRKTSDMEKLWTVSEQELGVTFDVANIVGESRQPAE